MHGRGISFVLLVHQCHCRAEHRLGPYSSHVCGGVTEDGDASDEEDGECAACGQLAAWCVCGQEWEIGPVSWDDFSDEQLPRGVYRLLLVFLDLFLDLFLD